MAGTVRVPDSPGSTPVALADAEVGVPDVTGPVRAPDEEPAEEEGFAPVPTDRPTQVMVTGDSVGFSLAYDAIDVPPDLAVTSRAVIGCGLVEGRPIVTGRPDPIGDDCADQPSYWQEGAEEVVPDVVVLVFGAWEVYDREIDGQRYEVGTPEMADLVRGGVDDGVRAVVAVAPEARFLLVGAPCMRPKDPQLGPSNPDAERADPVRLAWVNEQMEAAADALGPRAAYADLGEMLCPGGVFQEAIDGVEIRPDGLHYEPQTTGPTWAWLAERIRTLAATPVPADEVVVPSA